MINIVKEESKLKTRYKILLSTIVSAVIVVVVYYILFVLPNINRLDDSVCDRIIRQVYLVKWCRIIEGFQADTGRLPKSLYEAAWYKGSVPPIVIGQGSIRDPEFQTLRDPNVFFQEVEHALLVYPKGWYVIELKPGKYLKHRLMMDQDLKLYELKELNQCK